jgi:hypothetical protein
MYPSNRFLAVRDDSPGPTERTRANSIKRKEPEGPSFANIVSGFQPAKKCNFNMEVCSDLTLEVAKVSSLVDKAATEVNDHIKDPAVLSVFSSLVDAMRGIVTVQDKIVTKAFNGPAEEPVTPVPVSANSGNGTGSGMVNLGAIPKKPRTDTGSQRAPVPAPAAIPPRKQSAPESREDQIKRKFRDTIREAEKATCVFNLDMGKVPLLNKETMAKKATLALTTMAAAKENKNCSTPSEEAIAALDDVLSVAKNYCFLGNGTKSYRNMRDPLNGSYCTAPVKYEFKDKETRVNAELVLRTRCGVSCNVPYPVMVRESIKQIVSEVKKDFPDNYIRVSVDTEDLVFKIARKPPKSATDKRWQYGFKDIPIPECVLDTSVRKIPEGFKIELVTPNTNSQQDTVPDSQEVPVPMLTDPNSQESQT